MTRGRDGAMSPPRPWPERHRRPPRPRRGLGLSFAAVKPEGGFPTPREFTRFT